MSDETKREGTGTSPVEPESAATEPAKTADDGATAAAVNHETVEPAEATPKETAETSPAEETSAGDSVTAKTDDEGAGEPEPQSKPDAAAADPAEVERKAAESKARQARVAPLYRAFRGKRGISGHVEKAIKGGYEIRIGKARAFCPHSQIDVHRVDDPEAFVGTTQTFRITQLRRGGEDVVVSRRALIEEERKEEAAAVRATLIEGSVMLGRISGLAKFGAFVDLGAGVTGLVHITELSHGRVNRPDQAVRAGEAVRVKILKLAGENDRISLSIRQASEDPWVSAAENFESGKAYPGKVMRLADFGAFVELSPGIEALAPAGEFPPARAGWRDGLTPGSEHSWHVLNVDTERRRISLTPAAAGDEAALPELTPGATMNGKVQRVEPFGVFVWLGPGKVGLMPNVLTGTPPGTDLAKRFPIADEVEVEVVGIDDRGRIRLAKKGASRPTGRNGEAGASPRRDRPRRRPPRERIPETPVSDSAEGFGSLLADKLKDALG